MRLLPALTRSRIELFRLTGKNLLRVSFCNESQGRIRSSLRDQGDRNSYDGEKREAIRVLIWLWDISRRLTGLGDKLETS
jgi:hypothetical protein